jgi:hypothetical protein
LSSSPSFGSISNASNRSINAATSCTTTRWEALRCWDACGCCARSNCSASTTRPPSCDSVCSCCRCRLSG